jgi:hypothetical protein
MKQKLAMLAICCLISVMAAAQGNKDDRREEQTEKKEANKAKIDYSVFRRQILTLPEFAEQRRKMAELRAQSGGVPKIYAVVDTLRDNSEGNLLLGYIVTALGDNTANVFEVTFDRSLRKIILVTPTGETLEVEKEATAKNQKKKKKSEDEDGDEQEDEPEEKPSRGKQKDEDDE